QELHVDGIAILAEYRVHREQGVLLEQQRAEWGQVASELESVGLVCRDGFNHKLVFRHPVPAVEERRAAQHELLTGPVAEYRLAPVVRCPLVQGAAECGANIPVERWRVRVSRDGGKPVEHTSRATKGLPLRRPRQVPCTAGNGRNFRALTQEDRSLDIESVELVALALLFRVRTGRVVPGPSPERRAGKLHAVAENL